MRGVRVARSGPTGRAEGDQNSAMSLVFKRVIEGFLSYRSSEPELEEVDLWEIDPLCWRERIPFYR